MPRLPVTPLLIAFGLLALMLACQQSAPDTRAADEQAIRQASDVEWLQAARAKDVDRVLSFYADDAAVLPPNASTVTGKAAIRGLWSQLVGAPGFGVNWRTDKVEVARSGDLAYQRASFEITVNNPQGKPVTDRGRYVAIWKKEPDGSWKVVLDIWNSDQPPVPPQR